MGNRQTEKKESKLDDNWIPVVTPDRHCRDNQQQQQQQQQETFNPRDYKANTKWINPYSFLRPTETKQETTPTETETNKNTKTYNRQQRKMTKTKKTMATAKELKDEMRWSNKPKKKPTILEVLEFKAELIEGLRRCTYRGNKQGHTFLVETKDKLWDKIKELATILKKH